MYRNWAAAILTLLGLTLAGAATAQTYSVYDCRFIMRGSGGEPTDLLFAVDTGGRAFTFDTKPGSDRPVLVPVSMRKSGKDQLIFAYSFDAPNVERRLTLDMLVRVPVAGGASRISLTGRGFSGNPTGKGTCTFNQNVRLPG
jgi:hypothetical protein